MCALDETVLRECELPIPKRHNHFLLPNEVKSRPALNCKLSSACQGLMSELARFSSAIIFERPTDRDLHAVRSTILEALRDRGSLTKDGKIDRKYLISDLLQRYQPLIPLGYFSTDLSAGALNRLALQLSQNTVLSPKHQLLLLSHLFGSWECYQTKYLWNLVFPASDAKVQFGTAESVLEQYRTELVNVRKKFPNISRAGLSRAAGKAFRWLLQNDSLWLNENFALNLKSNDALSGRQLVLKISDVHST